jgi:hypothetical protein
MRSGRPRRHHSNELRPATSERVDPFSLPPLSHVQEGLQLLENADPDQLTSETLREDLECFVRVQRRFEALTARWLAAIDRRHQADPPQYEDQLQFWLQEKFNLSQSAANGQIRTARQLEQLPRTAKAFSEGELSSQQVSVICQAMGQLHQTQLDPAETESALLDGALEMDPQELMQHWLQLRYQGDQEAGEEAEDDLRRRRWIRLQRGWNDCFRIEGMLDPVGGSALKTVLQSLAKSYPREEGRYPANYQADALIGLATDRLDAGDLPQQGGERPHLMLVAELSTLKLEPGSPMAQLDWGPLVTGETARRLSCDASISPVLVDQQGEIIHVGKRKRTISSRRRRELNLRDRNCQGPGCDMPAHRCTPHHIEHWADGGSDELSNLRLLCGRHHALLHPENARFRRGAGRQRSAP